MSVARNLFSYEQTLDKLDWTYSYRDRLYLYTYSTLYIYRNHITCSVTTNRRASGEMPDPRTLSLARFYLRKTNHTAKDSPLQSIVSSRVSDPGGFYLDSTLEKKPCSDLTLEINQIRIRPSRQNRIRLKTRIRIRILPTSILIILTLINKYFNKSSILDGL